jgi:hypothetical protein
LKTVALHPLADGLPLGTAAAQAAAVPEPAIAEARAIRLVYCLLAAGAVMALLFVDPASMLQDPDNWWHVKVGFDLLSSLTLPTVDTYSYTFAGHPWIAKEWLGQILFALAYMAAGWNGVALLTIVAIALAMFLLAWHLGAELRPATALALTIGLAVLAAPLYNARPFIFTFPIIVVWTAALFRAAHESRAPSIWLLPLLCLWANLHGTFTFAFVIAFFAGLEVLERTRLSHPMLLAKWVGFGLLCPLASLLNPYGYKAILATFTVSHGNEAVPHIGEWQPFDASVDYLQEWALLLTVFAVLVSRLRIGWAKAAFFVFTLHLFFLHARFMYLLLLLVPVVLAADVAEQYPQLSARHWAAAGRDRLEQFLAARSRQVLGGLALLLVMAAAVFITVPRVAPSLETSAEGALAYAKEHGLLDRNVLNSYNLGGTLIFHGIETFIDGRTDQLFLDGFITKERESAGTAGKPVLRDLLEAHRVGWALLVADDSRIPFFDEMAGWRRAYWDDHAVIYVLED